MHNCALYTCILCFGSQLSFWFISTFSSLGNVIIATHMYPILKQSIHVILDHSNCKSPPLMHLPSCVWPDLDKNTDISPLHAWSDSPKSMVFSHLKLSLHVLLLLNIKVCSPIIWFKSSLPWSQCMLLSNSCTWSYLIQQEKKKYKTRTKRFLPSINAWSWKC